MRDPLGTVAATALLLVSCGGGTVPAEWQLVARPEGTSLEIEVAVGVPCNELGTVRAIESTTEVRVQASIRTSDGDCDAMFTTTRTTVELRKPLGLREVTGCAPPDAGAIRFGSTPVTSCGTAPLPLSEPFADPALAGLCEDFVADVGEDDRGAATVASALRAFVTTTGVLSSPSVEVDETTIRFRGEVVGRVGVEQLASGGHAVTSAEWCYPEG